MLTVVVKQHNGYHAIREADNVDFDVESRTIRIYHPKAGADGMWEYKDGYAFVMNDKGATIAKYALDKIYD